MFPIRMKAIIIELMSKYEVLTFRDWSRHFDINLKLAIAYSNLNQMYCYKYLPYLL